MGNPARTGENKQRKRKRTVSRRGIAGTDAAATWADVHPWVVQAIAIVSTSIGLAATPVVTRDKTAVGVRFWHPELDIQPWYGMPDGNKLLPSEFWDYVVQIHDALDIEPTPESQQVLDTMHEVSMHPEKL